MGVNGVNGVVPLSTPIQHNNPQETACTKKPPTSKRILSPERKTKQIKTMATDAIYDTPLVLTATKKGKVIAHGEEPV